MVYMEVDKDDEIIKYGDTNEIFFIILEGSVGIQAPNPSIEKWDWAMSVYHGLLEWKRT